MTGWSVGCCLYQQGIVIAVHFDIYQMQEVATGLATGANSNESEQIRSIFNKLITSSPLFKHPSFISEKEYRLVSLPNDIEKHLGKPHFFVEEDNIKKYYILKLREVCKNLGYEYSDLFKGIIIGPQAKVTVEVLADFFAENGMAELCPRIKISECPLRRF